MLFPGQTDMTCSHWRGENKLQI